MKKDLNIEEQVKLCFPKLTKQQLQLKVKQLKKEAAKMARTPDVSLHQYPTKNWAPVGCKCTRNDMEV
jgi:hypothetical protein